MDKTAITPTRAQDFSQWYQQVILAADLAQNSPVRGCMVIKPYGYAIWENIQKIFDARLKTLGVENAYFPLLIPVEFLSKEAEHIDGFAKECAVVTHHRLTKNAEGKLIPDGELSEPYVIRPTSEAIIGHVIADWIHSYRDLPLKLNQWCNVMRWEMRPRLFLRTSEFLWQEGHTVFASAEEAQADAQKMHAVYTDFIANTLLLPCIAGEKTQEEKFPGAVNTYTIEALMQDGKALQAGTSHYLGQSFSKAFNIQFANKENQEAIAYTSSWGLSTRLIGGIIMAHADDNGLCLPPAIAPYHVVIIPFIRDESQRADIEAYCQKLHADLTAIDLRVFLDNSEQAGSHKSWKWIKKGVPVRLEIGNNEVKANTLTVLRRDGNKADKILLPLAELAYIPKLLTDIAANLKNRALAYQNAATQRFEQVSDFEKSLTNNFSGFAWLHEEQTQGESFEQLMQQHALTRRCIINEEGKDWVIVAKSY